MPKNKSQLRKPKLTAEQRKAQRKAEETARDQFAALGRFVQRFEQIVDAIRWHCHRLSSGDNLGEIQTDPKVAILRLNITSMVFHHEVMTARPLLDIWRSLLAEHRKALKILGILSERGDEIAKGVSTEIAAEFEDICQLRNRLMHATWHIGYRFSEEFPELDVEKYRLGQDGFSRRADLPNTLDELTEYGTRCQRLHAKLGRFLQYYHYYPKDIGEAFEYSSKAGKWQKWGFCLRSPKALPASS